MSCLHIILNASDWYAAAETDWTEARPYVRRSIFARTGLWTDMKRGYLFLAQSALASQPASRQIEIPVILQLHIGTLAEAEKTVCQPFCVL